MIRSSVSEVLSLNALYANVTLTLSAATATVAVSYKCDGGTASTPVTESYTTSGQKILSLYYLLPELAAGDHTFEVIVEVTGGTMS